MICSELISRKSATEKKNTALEREWPPVTDARYCPEEERRAEKDCLTKTGSRGHSGQWSFSLFTSRTENNGSLNLRCFVVIR